MTEAANFYVYLSKGRVLLIGDSLEDDEHRHHALQITINLEPNAFTLRQGESEIPTQGIIIKPNAPHHVVSSDSWRAVLLLDAQTQYSQQIKQRFLAAQSFHSLADNDLHFCRASLHDFRARAQSIETADNAISAIIDRLAGPVNFPEVHPRIEKALSLIHHAQGKELPLSQLAALVFLSESRLSHLFKEEIGIPIQRYLLWYKVMQTAFNIGRGMSLTDAAEEAGFADSAHFSRTFRAMFGMTPSQILKRSRLVKIISDTE
ncbi:MAG TPA: AraC family transcriptional regulator [Spongiibacteraceae bacterium]|nr:AraC family transcriptional regulator [Spongiibacteraceae bacterium]